MINNKTDRRNFFTVIGKTSLGAMVLSALPSKLFASSSKIQKLKNVTIHKQAVKRVK
ncbi:MAG: hypothetical protein PF445_08330 [Melioribacteraceae bacterium]|jgi:hypothetical protein|nr:hypothetical protein [Melioribacteraceae bacterium]